MDDSSQLLSSARIPVTHRNGTIKDPKAKEWTLTGRETTSTGAGVCIYGGSPAAYALAYAVARGLALAEVGIKVFSLPTLVDLYKSGDIWEETKGVQCLFVMGMVSEKHETAFDDETRFRIEWFLRSWLDNGQSLCIHGENPLNDAFSFWSDSFVKRVSIANPIVFNA